MIKEAIRWTNGMVTVFDEHGEQLPEYQGKLEKVRENILKDAPADAIFIWWDWNTGTKITIPFRENW